MDIINDLIKAGRKNRSGLYLKPNFITIHDTGNKSPGADAKAHAKYLHNLGDDKTAAGFKSWHYTVDDKVIIRHIPDNEVAWNAGDGYNGKGNRESIHIEICIHSGIDQTKAEENAAWLTAELIKKHNIKENNIVQHNFWKSATYPSGKNCPRLIRSRSYGWVEFNNRVRKYIISGGDKPLDVT